jgi:diaminopimelate decarboxylase
LIEAVKGRFIDRGLTLLVEPGRSIAANAGIFVTRVEYIKCNQYKNFAIVDGAMNDLLRPALYGAWQEIVPVHREQGTAINYDVVGPVCESADFLGKDRELVLAAGDLLAVRSAGAYGFVMSSNYNTRPRSAEIMVDGSESYLVRERETVEQLLSLESCLPS